MRKSAVDKVTEDYWANYFEEYGRQWTRKIPRRVAKVLAHRLKKRQAGATHAPGAARATRATRIVRASIAPLGHATLQGGGMQFEGAFIGQTQSGQTQTLMFCAQFGKEGQLQALDAVVAPIAG